MTQLIYAMLISLYSRATDLRPCNFARAKKENKFVFNSLFP